MHNSTNAVVGAVAVVVVVIVSGCFFGVGLIQNEAAEMCTSVWVLKLSEVCTVLKLRKSHEKPD